MRLVSLLFVFLFFQYTQAQAPGGLTVDLLEHTDRVFLYAYPSNIQLEELPAVIEPYRLAEVRSEYPAFGWILPADKNNTRQRACRILLASSRELLERNEADIWDSGKMETDNSVAVKSEGKPLQAASLYFWKVKTWDNYGTESEYSEVKAFKTADKLDGKTAAYPLQIRDEYPVSIRQTKGETRFIDFGKTAFGRLRLRLHAETEDSITIHLGEHSIDQGVNRRPEGSIRYAQYKLKLLPGTHTYLIKIRPDRRNTHLQGNESLVDPILMPGEVGEVFPFRYAEIEAYKGEIATHDLVRQSVYYPFNETAARFSSSDTILNQVWELCKYSIQATSFMGIYIDGDRERIPYEADAYINQLCHYFTDREFTMARRTHEHLIHNPTWPTEWNLQSVLIAWNDYLYTGNRVSLENHYKDLQAKTLMALKEENGLISTRTGKLTDAFFRSIHFRGKNFRDIVDWPQKGIVGDEKLEAGEADGYVLTDYNTVVNAFHYQSVYLMSRIAGELGKLEESKHYAQEAERIRKQFNRLLLDPKTGYYKDGIDTDHHSLHANMLPLAFDMVPKANRKAVIDFIRSRKMACSVYGSQFLLDAVYDAHDAEYGLSLLTSTGERSWYNMIRVGSTLSLEAWDNKYKPNQDWNHAWGAAPANLIPRKLMGIEPIDPGFRKIRIKPQPGKLRQAFIEVPTIRGKVELAFDNEPGERFSMKLHIPANSEAEVWLPFISKKHRVWMDGKVQKGVVVDGFVKLMVGSGTYVFRVEK